MTGAMSVYKWINEQKKVLLIFIVSNGVYELVSWIKKKCI